MVVLVFVILGIVALAVAFKLAVIIGTFIAAHLALTILAVVLGSIGLITFLRLLIAVMERMVVMNWKSGFTRPPQRVLPAPAESAALGTAPRPFTLPAENHLTAAAVPASALLACEGPRCSSFLPGDQSMRWRIGTATMPQTDDDEDFPEDTEDIHEFCSEACLNRWQAANHATS